MTMCGGDRGFLAGAVGAVVTSPIDAIKTKLQVKEGGKRAGESFMAVTKEFIRAEGIGAFTRVGSNLSVTNPAYMLLSRLEVDLAQQQTRHMKRVLRGDRGARLLSRAIS